MYEVTPRNPIAQREKELVDHSYELPLSKITVSPWLSKLIYEKIGKNVVDVVPNSVNHSTFYPDPTSKSGSLTLLIPYRNSAWKGRREARQLIEYLRSTNVCVHTYGSGDDSDLPKFVEHHSDVTDDELRHLYSNADVFVLTSWVEGFGLPPLEAMACKCAVVATNVGSVPDYAEDGETASIVPPQDSNALIEEVSNLIRNDKRRHHLQCQGYNQTKEYTWADATAQFEGVLREIAMGVN
jgi:glycosyltransferase involved in cell wall biosynthesis